jgi:hypothetical protein
MVWISLYVYLFVYAKAAGAACMLSESAAVGAVEAWFAHSAVFSFITCGIEFHNIYHVIYAG